MFRLILLFLFFSVISSFIDTEYSKTFFLKENYKHFFKRPINYQYFSNDIELNSTLFPSIKGKEQYQFIFNSLQFLSKKIFLHYQIDILSTKETIDEVEILWKVNGFTKTFFPISLKGVSFYEKDERGFLKSHNITLNLKPNTVSFYNQTINISEFMLSCCKQFCPNNDDDDNYPHPLLKRPIRVPSDN